MRTRAPSWLSGSCHSCEPSNLVARACGCGCGCAGAWKRCNPVGEVLGVVADPAEQRGAAGVEPWKPQEVEPRSLCHAALLDDLSLRVECRRAHKRVVE